MGHDAFLGYLENVYYDGGGTLLFTYLVGFAAAFTLTWAFVKKVG